MGDHERIWLQAAIDADPSTGRMWCQDKVWPDDAEDSEPTEYVRADLFAAIQSEVGRLREALEQVAGETEVHTKLNQERLCCKFQDIAQRALDGGRDG